MGMLGSRRPLVRLDGHGMGQFKVRLVLSRSQLARPIVPDRRSRRLNGSYPMQPVAFNAHSPAASGEWFSPIGF
jgi:hypothetical protein